MQFLTLRRRQFLRAGSALAFAALPRPLLADDRFTSHDGLTTTLRAGKARVRMVGEEYPETEVWAYNGVEPGPVLRVRQGIPIRVTVVNELTETTTVHRHGMRLRRRMPARFGTTRMTTASFNWVAGLPAR